MYESVRKEPVPVFHADPAWCDQVRKVRQQLAGICGQCINRAVQIQTIDGRTYEGTVIGHEGSYLYLARSDNRFFGPYAASFILPLVLFDLLTITLLI